MDDLDQSLAELRRAVIDGAIRAEVGRWRSERRFAGQTGNATTHGRQPSGTVADTRARSAKRLPGVSTEAFAVPGRWHGPLRTRLRSRVLAVLAGLLAALLFL